MKTVLIGNVIPVYKSEVKSNKVHKVYIDISAIYGLLYIK